MSEPRPPQVIPYASPTQVRDLVTFRRLAVAGILVGAMTIAFNVYLAAASFATYRDVGRLVRAREPYKIIKFISSSSSSADARAFIRAAGGLAHCSPKRRSPSRWRSI
jgi:hypothetical protein